MTQLEGDSPTMQCTTHKCECAEPSQRTSVSFFIFVSFSSPLVYSTLMEEQGFVGIREARVFREGLGCDLESSVGIKGKVTSETQILLPAAAAL